jgi:hypothetical protein
MPERIEARCAATGNLFSSSKETTKQTTSTTSLASASSCLGQQPLLQKVSIFHLLRPDKLRVELCFLPTESQQRGHRRDLRTMINSIPTKIMPRNSCLNIPYTARPNPQSTCYPAQPLRTQARPLPLQPSHLQ